MKLGPIDLTVLRDGTFALDGGAMFGVVPRPLWRRLRAPDALNRIHLALNCLLIRSGGRTLLVETGIGRRGSARFRRLYACRGIGRLCQRLREHGVAPAGIDTVILTHLHFDHAGGVTSPGPEGRWEATFPNAEVWVQRGEWEAARRPNERTRATYLPETFEPLEAEGRLRLLQGEAEAAPGVRLEVLGGHTRDLMGVWIEAGAHRALFASDLVPTAAHLKYAYIMAYDIDPLRTLEQKKRLLLRAAREGWWWIFPHDARPVVRLEEAPDGGVRPLSGVAQ